MASSMVKLNKNMKMTDIKRTHSSWWDSHTSSKNSKWLADNLEEMDHSVKRMLKLIEDDGDSFAKKADMYYQKRPDLINQVEEFYRMYKSLAERYDHVTGELRKNLASDLQSQGSGLSDGSESSFAWCSPDNKLSRRKSGPRAAGFEFFLGSGGNGSDCAHKEGDESSTLDSESEIDDSSVNSGLPGDGGDQWLQKRVLELEAELCEVKEKLRLQHIDNLDGFSREDKTWKDEVLPAKISRYEEELKISREDNMLSKQEIASLKNELQKYKSLKFPDDLAPGNHSTQEYTPTSGFGMEKVANYPEEKIDTLDVDFSGQESKIQSLSKAISITEEKFYNSKKEVESLRRELEKTQSSAHESHDQLGSAQKEIQAWKNKFDREKKEVSKLQDRIARYKANLLERDQEIRGLKEAVSNANKTLAEENLHLQAEITKLLKERTFLEDNIKEWDFRRQSLEEDVRRIKAEKIEMEGALVGEIEQLKANVKERDELVEELKKNLDEIKLKHDLLLVERDELSAKAATLTAEMGSKVDSLRQLSNQLDMLNIKRSEVITESEKAHVRAEELRLQVVELEAEIKRLQELIHVSAEEKREAIRQLCFSLEHYRSGYNWLRRAFMVQKRLPVMAS